MDRLEFAESQRAVENREKWRKLVVKLSVVRRQTLRVRGRWWCDIKEKEYVRSWDMFSFGRIQVSFLSRGSWIDPKVHCNSIISYDKPHPLLENISVSVAGLLVSCLVDHSFGGPPSGQLSRWPRFRWPAFWSAVSLTTVSVAGFLVSCLVDHGFLLATFNKLCLWLMQHRVRLIPKWLY